MIIHNLKFVFIKKNLQYVFESCVLLQPCLCKKNEATYVMGLEETVATCVVGLEETVATCVMGLE